MNQSLMSIAFAVALTGSYIMGDSGSPLLTTSQDTGTQADSQQLVNLKERLERATLPSEKLALLKEVSSSNDSLGKQSVLEYFMSLPPSEITTNPHSDFFKVEVFEIVLPLLDFKERKKFVENVLDNELINLRTAYCNALGNKYPKSLWNKIVSIIDSDEAARDFRDRFSLIAKDELLPLQVRSSALAANMRYDLEKNKDAEMQKLQNVLEHIPLMPEAVIPWEHYNDKGKYSAYVHSEAYKTQIERTKEWRKAGQEVVFEGNLEFLQTHGLKAIEIIVSILGRTDLPRERQHGLAKMAARILARLKMLSQRERESVDQLVGKLEKYIDKMPDSGYFGTRYYAIQALQSYYSNQGIKQGYPFKDGRTRQHPSLEVVANAQAIATNRVSGSGFPASTNMLQKRETPQTGTCKHSAIKNDKNLLVYATLALLLVLGVALSVFWIIRWRK